MTDAKKRYQELRGLTEPSLPDLENIRQSVLYLRAFSEDNESAEGLSPKYHLSEFAPIFLLVALIWRIRYGPGSWAGLRSFDVLIGDSLRREIGDVIALGDPSVKSRRKSMARYYVDSSVWRKVAGFLIENACCTIVVPGTSTSLGWELLQLREKTNPRTVFLLTEPDGGIRESWALLKRSFIDAGWEIPLTDPGPGSVIGFDRDHRAKLLAHGLRSGDAFARTVSQRLQKRDRKSLSLLHQMESVSASPSREERSSLSLSGSFNLGECEVPPGEEFSRWLAYFSRHLASQGPLGLLVIAATAVAAIMAGTVLISSFPEGSYPRGLVMIIFVAAGFIGFPVVSFFLWIYRGLPGMRCAYRLRGHKILGEAQLSHIANLGRAEPTRIYESEGKTTDEAVVLEGPSDILRKTAVERYVRWKYGASSGIVNRNSIEKGRLEYEIVKLVAADGAKEEEVYFEVSSLSPSGIALAKIDEDAEIAPVWQEATSTLGGYLRVEVQRSETRRAIAVGQAALGCVTYLLCCLCVVWGLMWFYDPSFRPSGSGWLYWAAAGLAVSAQAWLSTGTRI